MAGDHLLRCTLGMCVCGREGRLFTTRKKVFESRGIGAIGRGAGKRVETRVTAPFLHGVAGRG